MPPTENCASPGGLRAPTTVTWWASTTSSGVARAFLADALSGAITAGASPDWAGKEVKLSPALSWHLVSRALMADVTSVLRYG